MCQHKLAEVKTSIAVARAFIDQCMELHEVTNNLVVEVEHDVVGGQVRERVGLDGQVLDHRVGEQGGRRLLAAARRLG